MIHYPNKDDFDEKFYPNNYKVFVTAQGIEFHVNAHDEGEAIDAVIDYCEEKEMKGLVSSYLELKDDDYTDTEIEDFTCGGNHGLYLTTHNIHIEKL